MDNKILETERLFLTPFKVQDAEELYAYAKDPDVGPHAGWKPHESVEESKMIIEGMFIPTGAFCIRLKDKDGKPGKLIGSIALETDRFRPDARSKEIGYSLDRKEWGKGYMTEAAGEIIRYAFEDLDMEILTICTSPVNERSQRVAEKNNFQYEGKIRKAYRIYTGQLRDSLVFSLAKEDWNKTGQLDSTIEKDLQIQQRNL
ncbi:MAG: GNAT family protein [Clostridiales bacterium]|nr:GNAT family protein [Clostridiales bacterium]MDY4060207.1 GNAT family protein [Anaerovoracaceae bacterium]